MEEWWVIPGVQRPVYVELGRSRRGYGFLVLALFILSLIVGEVSGFLPSGITILMTTLLLLIQGILNILAGVGRPRLGRTDIIYIQNLLKTLSRYISKWSIPSRNIPVVASTTRGVYLILYYHRGVLTLLLVKPLFYYGVIKGRPIVKIKPVSISRGCFGENTISIGLADLIFPHPEIRYMNYRVRSHVIIPKQQLNPEEINNLLGEFDRFFIKGGG